MSMEQPNADSARLSANSQWFGQSSLGTSGSDSCFYLRLIDAPDLSMEELVVAVYRLAGQSRRGACFACLRGAGCIEWGSSPEPACQGEEEVGARMF